MTETLLNQIDKLNEYLHLKSDISKKDFKYIDTMLQSMRNEAINYTRCCEELKELDNDNFEDWLIVNGYTVFDDYYLKGDIAFSESELMQKYNDQVMNL